MFDGICILTALFLFYKVEFAYRDVAFLVLCWFVVSDVIYHYLLLDFRNANNWVIYQFYNVINVVIFYKLKPLVSAPFILLVLGLNVLLNIVVSFWFISTTDDKMIYDSYPYPAGILMLLALSYMWCLGYGIRRVEFYRNNRKFFYSFLRVCLGKHIWRGDRLQSKGLVG